MTSRRSTRSTAPVAAGPMEDEDILSQILLRLPKQPSSLVRASVLCKQWYGLVSSPSFLRRYRKFHRTPPLLGLFVNNALGSVGGFLPTGSPPDSVPAERFLIPLHDRENWEFLDCRHGRVLVLNQRSRQILVWDPMARSRHVVHLPPAAETVGLGAVLCDHTQEEDGGDCPSNPFRVVLVWAHEARKFAAVYSSQSRAWSSAVAIDAMFPLPRKPRFTNLLDEGVRKHGVLVGNVMYWLLPDGSASYIVEFDADRQRLSEIPVDEGLRHSQSQLILTEDADLGLAVTCYDSIQVWKREINASGGWVRHRIILLDIPLTPTWDRPRYQLYMIGFNEDTNTIFIHNGTALFMVQLDSAMKSKELCSGAPCGFSVFPYASFYSPGI